MTGFAWPEGRYAHGGVVLRAFDDRDVAMVQEMSADPYVPSIGTLEPDADEVQARRYIARQRGRHLEGRGYSFCVADARTDAGLGQVGLWLRDLDEGRATAGYSIAPSARGRGAAADALVALAGLAWEVPGLDRVTLFIEPWNAGSVATAERAGFEREGLVRRWMEIGGRRADMLVYGVVRPG